MTLLITIFLVLINIFNTIQTNSPQVPLLHNFHQQKLEKLESSSSDMDSWCLDKSSEDDINTTTSSEEFSLLTSSSDEKEQSGSRGRGDERTTALRESPRSAANASYAPDDDETKEVSDSTEELMNTIIENEGE